MHFDSFFKFYYDYFFIVTIAYCFLSVLGVYELLPSW